MQRNPKPVEGDGFDLSAFTLTQEEAVEIRQRKTTARSKRPFLKGPIDCGWLDVLYRSNSVKVVKLALDIRRQTDLANKEWVQLEEGRLSRVDRSRAFSWLRKMGLIETRKKPGLRMFVRLLPWKPGDG